jgi:hypothetical protein
MSGDAGVKIDIDRELAKVTMDQSAYSEKLKREMELHKAACLNTTHFIGPWFDDMIRLFKGITLVGGVAKSGKTTTSANIVYGFLRDTQKNAMILQVEEPAAIYLGKLSCYMEGQNPDDWVYRKLPEEALAAVDRRIDELSKRVKVFNSADDNVNKLERVLDFLRMAEHADVGLFVLDYLQAIDQTDQKDKQVDGGGISRALLRELSTFASTSTIPIVVLAQLKPASGDRTKDVSPKNRVEMDTQAVNKVNTFIEIVVDKHHKVDIFRRHETRNPVGPKSAVYCRWTNGLFAPMSEEEVLAYKRRLKAEKEQSKEMTAEEIEEFLAGAGKP